MHPKAGPAETDLPRPTTVLIGRDGKVKWVSQYNDVRMRPDPDDILRMIQSD